MTFFDWIILGGLGFLFAVLLLQRSDFVENKNILTDELNRLKLRVDELRNRADSLERSVVTLEGHIWATLKDEQEDEEEQG